MKNGFLLLGASALCILALTSLPVASLAGGPVKPKVSMKVEQFDYMPRFSVGPFYQTGSDSFGLYDLFVPFTMSSKSIFFLDGRYIDRSNTREYNVGAGLRNITNSGNLLWTLYSFYDNRRTRFSNYFGQVTVGADLQTEKWYFNTNGYIPVGKKQQFVDAFNTAFLCSNNTRICYARGIEKSMGGWDAEVGYDMFRGFKGYAGMYVFARSGVKTAIGPNLRLQYDIERQNQKRVLYLFNKIALIANWRDDQLVGSSWYAGVRFDIGLGPDHHMVGLERKMTSFIRRDLNVEMSSDGTGSAENLTQPVRILTNDFNGQETQVALVGTAATLTAAAANPRDNILGVRGTIPIVVTTNVQDNQIVEGGVFSFTREGANFSVQVGQNGTLTTALGINFITVASLIAASKSHIFIGQDVTVENMAFTGLAAGVGAAVSDIAAFNVGNLVIRNNSVVGADLAIVRGTAVAADVANVSITDNFVNTNLNTALDTQIYMVAAAASTLNATISGNTLNSSGTADVTEQAIRADGAAGVINVAVANNAISYTAVAFTSPAVDFVGTAGLVFVVGNMSGNTVASSGLSALRALDNVTFQGNINNNALTANAAPAAQAVMELAVSAVNLSLHVVGAITGNTITNSAGGATDRAVALAAILGGTSVAVDGGFVNNTVTIVGPAGLGVITVTGVTLGSVTLGAFNGNTFTNTVAGGAISTNIAGTGTFSTSIGGGATAGTVAALEAANGLPLGASVTLGGVAASNVITP